jgi:hypothetical protein
MSDGGNQGKKHADLAIAHIVGEAVMLLGDASGVFPALEDYVSSKVNPFGDFYCRVVRSIFPFPSTSTALKLLL